MSSLPSPTLDIALIFSIAVIFILNAVDSSVARRWNETSQTGALLDALGDRTFENTFWCYFTMERVIPLWMPIVVMARGVFTDTLQRTQGSPENRWTHALTRSSISRAVSGISKMFAFTSLASQTVLKNPAVENGSLILAMLVVGCCAGSPSVSSGNRHL